MSTENPLFSLAERIINHTGRHLFLTGRAGTGKTTFLRHIQAHTPKKAVIVAPTGVAALNAGGVTMHSFFQLPLGMYLPTAQPFLGDEWSDQLVVNRRNLLSNLRLHGEKRSLIKELELLIIDEVSMLRADALDAIDAILRSVRNQAQVPFGGVQVLFIGDLFQLPPVLRNEEASLFYEHYRSPFFFSANVIAEAEPLVVELQHVYRQRDEDFIRLLNAIRNNCAEEEDLALLHQRYKPWQEPEEGSILLTTHNHIADRVNAQRLEQLPGEPHRFDATIEGDFNERALPTERFLDLKVGAQVMFIKNDSARRYYNGKLARVSHIGEEGDIWVQPEGSEDELRLELHPWRNIRYRYNRESDSVDEEELGVFRQYPVRLAWAITIHKSQGLTFEKATIDAGESFAAGQVYVALSRLTSLEGMVLRSRIPTKGIEVAEDILAFCGQQMEPEKLLPIVVQEEEDFAQQRLVQWFSLDKLLTDWQVFQLHYSSRQIPEKEVAEAWSKGVLDKIEDLEETATKFRHQLDGMLRSKQSYADIRARVFVAEEWLTAALRREVLQPLSRHHEDFHGKSRTKKYLTDLAGLERTALTIIQRWGQAKLLADSLAKGKMHLPDLKEQPAIQSTLSKRTRGKKIPTGYISLALYREGKHAAEIARERGLTVGTIEAHLMQFIKTGEVPLSEFVTLEQQRYIEAAIQKAGVHTGLTQLRELLGDDYSFTMIRAVILNQSREEVTEK